MSFQSKFKEFLSKDSMALDDMTTDDHTEDDIDYADRCLRLEKRCDEIRADNQRLIHNIYKMKKLSKKFNIHKKLLMKRLDKHKDHYRNQELPLFLENDHSFPKSSNEIKPKTLSKPNSNSNVIHQKSKKSKPSNSRTDGSVVTANGTVCVAPKKPINPYLLFCQENRSTLQEKYQMKHNTEMTHQELTKALAQQWHELSLTAKQVYYNLFNNEKVRYENEMKVFTANTTKESAAD